MDSSAILLNCLNISCSALILILKCLSVVMIEDFVFFKICLVELLVATLSFFLSNNKTSAVESAVMYELGESKQQLFSCF